MTPQHQQQMEQGISPHIQRTVSMDSNSFDPYGNGLVTPQYTHNHSPAMSTAGISPIHLQMQYQQAMLAQAQAAQQQQQQRPPGFYGNPNAMATGMGNGMAAAQMMDPYRQGMNGATMAPPGMGGYAPQQGYGNPMMAAAMGGMNGYGQFQMPQQYYAQAQTQGQMGGQRRGRR
ncbi:hypothetical protein LTR53_018062 [Teratosphaeriaceae sp. CCFEE 6253]|nr:hypothetical protein LTR53_018062 [Teratosphaeriaceae sp. CCFEE 6253]